jgi:hypothetical protein
MSVLGESNFFRKKYFIDGHLEKDARFIFQHMQFRFLLLLTFAQLKNYAAIGQFQIF